MDGCFIGKVALFFRTWNKSSKSVWISLICSSYSAIYWICRKPWRKPPNPPQYATLKTQVRRLIKEGCVWMILSLLTMKKAARISLLSNRWRYLWTYIAALNFDASHIIYGLELGDKKPEVERHLYLSWVNQVLKSHYAPTINEFNVQFDLDVTCKFDIDNWVNFVVEKRVKRLEFDSLENWGKTSYNFPDADCITNHLHSLFLGFTSFNSLTNLFLKYVDCLEITYCFNVESIEISAMNLVSFMYFGPKISLPFKTIKEPIERYIRGDYYNYLICNFWEISRHLSQLESLTLDVTIIETQ
ncbi:putative F-box/FBD/LRR-repeat protein At1g66300 [Cornus florida]|uniref:putative F-box/FBD/LRR-repeat protein At1g66300 n=1 Tax=Cornus florida TaxID=4283 RepID=UPI00289BCFC8|nr:putative F-box/FBD/LRR-repeat protein At1g66300 [Cornus florida]